jgi:hypothetical protein
VISYNYISGTNVRVLIDVVIIIAAYAIREPKHVGANFIILTILIN